MAETPIYQVDAFTGEPFRGNPAGVCPLEGPRPPAWMQSVAAEMNVSQTAFLWREGVGYRLRWFTPKVEVSLCGHATLASAHVLFERGDLAPGSAAVFETASGKLVAERRGEGIEMDFPAYVSRPTTASEAVLRTFGVEPIEVSVISGAAIQEDNYLVELRSEAEVRNLAPDLSGLRAPGSPGVIVTARADSPEYDFVSRYFAPVAGIDEDPVTGMAHCCLAPYWSRKLGKVEMVGYQASARGGIVGVRHDGDRVKLRGRAVTVLRGTLLA